MEISHPLRIVTPTLDGDILTVLARAEAEFTVGDLQRVLGAFTQPGIRRVLQRLTRQGIVREETHGRTRSYALNRNHLGASHIVALANLNDTLLERLRAEFAAWPLPPTYAALFGSGARHDHTTASDLDLFLVTEAKQEDAAWDAQVAELARKVTLWTGNDTRPITYPAQRVRELAATDPLLRSVADEGIGLAGDPGWLRRALRANRAHQ